MQNRNSPPLSPEVWLHDLFASKSVQQGIVIRCKAAENLEFEEAARLRDEVKRLEAVELAVADDPLARQQAVEKASDAAVGSRGRSTAGRPGQRGGNVKRRGKG
ncbi:hypothetical protein ACSSV8_001870 [Roseovarius sp. MBR-79]